jgi:putative PEP-CTERM system TPR-repeat lipoprotein
VPLLPKWMMEKQLLTMDAFIEQVTGNTSLAKSKYQALIARDKTNIDAQVGLAQLATDAKDWTKAINIYKEVLIINPQHLQAAKSLAVSAINQGKVDEAQKHLLNAIGSHSGNAQAQLQISEILGRVYLSQQKPDKLLNLASQLNQQTPGNNAIRLYLAKAYMMNKRNKEAETLLNQILLNNNSSTEAHLLLAKLIAITPSRLEEALEVLASSRIIEPDNLSINHYAVSLLIKKQDYSQALKIAKAIQVQYPDVMTGKILEADVFLAQQKYVNAIPIFQQAFKERPSSDLLASLVQSLLGAKQSDKMMGLLNQILQSNPKNIQALYYQANQFIRQDEKAKAISSYEKILAFSPQHLPSLNNISMLYLESDKQKALKYAKTAYGLAPHSNNIKDSYGFILVKSGKYLEGLKLIQEVEKSEPHNSDVKYHLAYALNKVKKSTEAIDILKNITTQTKMFSEKTNAIKLLNSLNKS